MAEHARLTRDFPSAPARNFRHPFATHDAERGYSWLEGGDSASRPLLVLANEDVDSQSSDVDPVRDTSLR
jgi:hypothetical protein